MSRVSHKSIKTAIPIARTVRMPFTLDPHAQAIKTPVAMSQPHHSTVNSLRCFLSLVEFETDRIIPIAKFAEPDIAINGKSHEKDKCSV
jgi:hypothetical protein